MSNNLDNLFKKALQEQECEPPARVWTGIEKQLNRRRRMIGGWWLRSIAAAVAIVFAIGLWQLLQNKEEMQVVEHIPVSPSPSSWDTPSPTATETLAGNMEVDKVSSAVNQVIAPTVNETISKHVTPVRQQESYTDVLLADNKDFGIKDVRRDFIPLTSSDAVRNQEAYRMLLGGENVAKKEKEKAKITLSGHVTPAYSGGSYSSSVKNTRGYSYSDSQLDGMMNIGGGMSISITPKKRLSFQTGITYSRMGQRTTESSASPRIAAFSTDKTSRRVNTPLGNVKTNRKAVAYRTAEAIVLGNISETDETIEQVFGSIEIPIHVRYQLNDNKVLFSLSGGFSGGFLVNNKVYMKESGKKELMGSTEDIRKFNLSTDLGLGIEYPLSRKIRIMVEPGFRYYLQSLSKNEMINFKPYTFTFSTGLGIEF